jgi:two-component system sensor histidine kinase KdpD
LMMSSAQVRSEYRCSEPVGFAGPDQILAEAAHELRLPVSNIKGLVSTLRRTDVEVDEDIRQDYLADIEDETNRLADMLEFLLDSYSLEDGSAQAAPTACVSPSRVLRSAVGRLGYRGHANSRLVVDAAPELPAVRMDPLAVERVLLNLIENALKYSPEDKPVVVRARMTDRDEVEFIVDDRGPGVPASEREHIFEPFFRLRRQAEAGPPDAGHGLGLTICRSIVMAHGGSLEASDRPGGGGRFRVRLPTRR